MISCADRRELLNSEDEGTTILRNVGNYRWTRLTSQKTSQPSVLKCSRKQAIDNIHGGDFRHPPRSRYELRSSGLLHSV